MCVCACVFLYGYSGSVGCVNVRVCMHMKGMWMKGMVRKYRRKCQIDTGKYCVQTGHSCIVLFPSENQHGRWRVSRGRWRVSRGRWRGAGGGGGGAGEVDGEQGEVEGEQEEVEGDRGT